MLEHGSMVCGTRQAERALLSGVAAKLYVARDADPKVVRKAVDLARERGIEVVFVESMAELGRACKLRVGCAAACLLREGYSKKEVRPCPP